MGRSVLDDLGEEVTGIVAPVSLCMALTVALVRILNPSGSSNSNAVFIASAFYTEQASGDHCSLGTVMLHTGLLGGTAAGASGSRTVTAGPSTRQGANHRSTAAPCRQATARAPSWRGL